VQTKAHVSESGTCLIGQVRSQAPLKNVDDPVAVASKARRLCLRRPSVCVVDIRSRWCGQDLGCSCEPTLILCCTGAVLIIATPAHQLPVDGTRGADADRHWCADASSPLPVSVETRVQGWSQSRAVRARFE